MFNCYLKFKTSFRKNKTTNHNINFKLYRFNVTTMNITNLFTNELFNILYQFFFSESINYVSYIFLTAERTVLFRETNDYGFFFQTI